MGFKSVEDRRKYAREYHKRRMETDVGYAEKYRARAAEKARKRYLENPEYRERCRLYAQKPASLEAKKIRDAVRTEQGYFREWHRKDRERPGVRGKQAETMRAWRTANPEKTKEISNKSKAKTRKERPHLHRHQWLKWAYGMSLPEYEAKLEAQSGVCLTCAGNNGGKPLVVDHDHNKPKGEGNRGLLCTGCNLAVGAVLENPETLHALAKYLEGYCGA